jgi:O-antigen/teichoic acid export membrane protein
MRLSLPPLFTQLLQHRLLRDTAHVGFWQAARLGGQALWVLLIARLLGPQGYGTFAGIAGLATTLGGLTGLGLGLVLLQDASREPALFDDRWRKARDVSLLSGVGLSVLFVGLAASLFGGQLSLLSLAAIGVSELLCLPMVNTAAFAFSARQRMGLAAAWPAVVALARVLAALLCWLSLRAPTLDDYVLFHLLVTALCAFGACASVHWLLKPQPAAFTLSRRDLIEGGGFSLVGMVGNALTSLDKTLVLRLAGAPVAGLYGATYRLASILAMPVDALTMAAGPRLFRHGGGQQVQPGLVAKLAAIALGYASLAAIALWLLAGVLPWLLGEAFRPAVQAARWMALFVPCYSLRLLGSNILMSSDRKRVRVAVECLGLVLLAGFGGLWLPRYGLLGAVLMICATEATLAAITWAAILRGSARR